MSIPPSGAFEPPGTSGVRFTADLIHAFDENLLGHRTLAEQARDALAKAGVDSQHDLAQIGRWLPW